MFPALRTLTGLACAAVPFAIAIHIAAELLALGGASDVPAFVLRHAYLVLPLLLTVRSFCTTVGLGHEHREVVRRCAIARSRLRLLGTGTTLLTFAAANLGFFVLTQLLEDVPIAAGSLGTGIVAALVGSILAAVIVFFWGRAVARIALALVMRTQPLRKVARACFTVLVAAPRCASNAYTLFTPNRPPPQPSFL